MSFKSIITTSGCRFRGVGKHSVAPLAEPSVDSLGRRRHVAGFNLDPLMLVKTVHGRPKG